ncbi:protein ENHANCED PSEUDOMONAS SUSCEPTIBILITY 1-like [Salvia miltiorrhiza]|uniref:protein ENHANCED PSEUDOMONAS SUSCEPTIBILITY 1-like n=1 Tax=Salvia miltiorrhiza TaxID=226208 RepID=UPI0025AD86D1|nr:protein ENHANCED PSEUDOMONAS SUSCEPTIBILITY 1-like [Salvia miltiorrhiza]
MPKKVELISSSLVRGTATAASVSRLELNPWDLRFLPISPIQRGLIFHSPHFQSQQNLIQRLQTSLSRALDFFPPLAGRLAATPHDGDTASFHVDCDNAGAEFTHAVAAAVSISDIIEPTYLPEIVSSLIPINTGVTNYQGISKPLLAVQVTELADGVFIGCAANHAVVDGASFWHFLNSWSEISRGSESISKSPIFDRRNAAAGVDENRLIHIPTLEKNLKAPIPLLQQKLFHFSKETLGQLKAKANSEAGTDKISTLQALMAHLWRSTVRSQTTNNDPTTPVMTIVIGARARMSSFPDGYFGNAICSATLAIGEDELLQEGLGAAALRINEVISEKTDEAIARDAEKKAQLGRMGVGMGGGPPLLVGGSHRFDMYGCDFGWGKPIVVRSGNARKTEGLVVVSPAAEADGIDLEVYFKKKTLRPMEEFLTMLHQ